MSQSIRISTGFGPTLQHIPNTRIFGSKHTLGFPIISVKKCIFGSKHTLGFPIISVKKCRNRGWISVSNNRNPQPPFLLYATLKDEEGGTSTGVISTVVQRFCKMLGSYFSEPPLKPGSKPPSVFELWQDLMKIMETARSFEDMEQALLMASGSVKGMKSVVKVDNISEPARKIVNHITGKEMLSITGLEMLRRKRSIVQITTGSHALDELLGGGIGTMATTETFGESGSGRSLLAHTLCVTTQLPTNMHGGNGKVAFIDTQGTFRPDRIVPIAERFGMDAGAVMDNIEYVRAYTYEDQYNFLLGLVTKMSKESTIRLLIVDSVIALIRDFELAKSQEKLIEMLSFLRIITQEFNVAVYVINQLIAEPGDGIMSISAEPEPAGGRTMAELAKIRLMFSKGKGEQRVCRLYKAPHNLCHEAEAIFQITPGGIADANN